MSFPFKDTDRPGKYLFLAENKPAVVKLLEDLGQIPAVGKYAENEQGQQNFWEAFKVILPDGLETILVGGWRLRRDLQNALKESAATQPVVEITVTYTIEKLRNGPKAVKTYAVKELPQEAGPVPF